MELKITQTEYNKIERLARCAISAYSKKTLKTRRLCPCPPR